MLNPQGVRRASPADYDALLAAALNCYAENALQPVSHAKVGEIVRRCVEQDQSIAGIIDGPAGLEASVGLSIASFDYSDERHLRCLWLGVEPAHRKTPHGVKLMEFAQWAQSVLEVPLYLDLTTVETLQSKMHLYLRTAPQVGAFFAFGAVPEGQFNQSRVGDDPHEARIRARKAVARGNLRRPSAAA